MLLRRQHKGGHHVLVTPTAAAGPAVKALGCPLDVDHPNVLSRETKESTAKHKGTRRISLPAKSRYISRLEQGVTPTQENTQPHERERDQLHYSSRAILSTQGRARYVVKRGTSGEIAGRMSLSTQGIYPHTTLCTKRQTHERGVFETSRGCGQVVGKGGTAIVNNTTRERQMNRLKTTIFCEEQTLRYISTYDALPSLDASQDTRFFQLDTTKHARILTYSTDMPTKAVGRDAIRTTKPKLQLQARANEDRENA